MQGNTQTQSLTMGALLRQFMPLALSDLIMIAANPIIIAVMARLANQEVNLAAFGVAQSMAILIESPIIMLLHAANALSRYQRPSETLRRFMIWMALGLTAIYGLLAFTPLFHVVFEGWLATPPEIAAAAQPAFQWMLLWPAAIAWRRFYQGMLIGHKLGGKVGLASFFRLGSFTAVALIGLLLKWPGATVGGMASVVSVLVEAAAVTYYARRELSSPVWSEEQPSLPKTLSQMAVWYLPLGVTALIIWVSKPALSGGIARASEATLSLAAWPAVWTTMMLLGNAVRMVQQVVISQATSPENYAVLRRFTNWSGALASLALALMVFTSAGEVLLTKVASLSGALFVVALPALQLGFLFPLAIAWQNHMQGLLIRSGRTKSVNLAALSGTVVLVVTMFAGVSLGWLGTVVAVVATMVGLGAELLLLLWLTGPHRKELSLHTE